MPNTLVLMVWLILHFLLPPTFMNAEFEPRIIGLTGAASAVRQMAQEYRVYFKKVEEEGDDYLVESSHSM